MNKICVCVQVRQRPDGRTVDVLAFPAERKALFGDPYPDTPKQLVVHYQDGAGVVHVLVIPDGAPVHFAVDRTPQGLHVIRALYALASNHGIIRLGFSFFLYFCLFACLSLAICFFLKSVFSLLYSCLLFFVFVHLRGWLRL
jgi:hypothetical protein